MKRDTKARIIDATIYLLATNPLEPITLEKIASQVGISKPAIYRHFSSKDELLKNVDETFLADAYVLFDTLDPNRENDPAYLMETFTEALLPLKMHLSFLSHLIIARQINLASFLQRLFSDPSGNNSNICLLYRSSVYFFFALPGLTYYGLQKETIKPIVHTILDWYSHGLGISPAIDDQIWQKGFVAPEEIVEDRFLIAMNKVASKYELTGLTIQRIATELHLASSSLYYSFPTKEALVRETAKKEQQQFLRILDNKVSQARNVSEALQILFCTSGSYLAQRPQLGIQFNTLSSLRNDEIPDEFIHLRTWNDEFSSIRERAGHLSRFLAIAPQINVFSKSTNPSDWMKYSKNLFRFFSSGCTTEEI
ncbi:TetR/AcrR family transcriptional regulator [uncultured Sphaerochaeta sp.]|uniref:TetR/AcrR family transcriptional regulator n=1 Tax=uncultured Sphaerochaeta sp. TaxID=886478 RepID=UPI002A0A1112|nr:TetR/AcrR family transcriptional regulator [uncultured Sphaerochaeta sp.]